MDYFQILNLQREPFSNSPEPDFFFQSDQHRGCLQKLELAVRLRRGLNVVIGDVGTGKTTLCRRLILNFSQTEEDRKQIETHLILDPSFSNAQEFLSMVCLFLDNSTSTGEQSEWQLKENIKNSLFRKGIDEGKIVVLIIDEGQKLPDFCREILREFLNYETNKYKLLQIVIFAQQEFEQTLKAHKNFADRVNQYYYLQPFNFRDTRAMIGFRIAKAGSAGATAPALFSFPALWAVHRATGGYPRRIITLCHQVMLAMIIQNRSRAGFFLVRSCAVRVAPAEAATWPRWAFTLTGAAVAVFLIIANYGRLVPLFSFNREDAVTKPAVIVAKTTQVPAPAAPPAPAESVTNTQGTAMLPVPEAKHAAETVAPAKKLPTLLGELIVEKNDYVLKILERINEKGAFMQLRSVARLNPHIKDLNWVRKGDVIRIPIRPRAVNPLPQGKYWVQMAAFGDLKEAYDLLNMPYDLPRRFLLSYWTATEGTTFAVLLKEGFDDESAALSAIKALPQPFAISARVVSTWPEGTVFL